MKNLQPTPGQYRPGLQKRRRGQRGREWVSARQDFVGEEFQLKLCGNEVYYTA